MKSKWRSDICRRCRSTQLLDRVAAAPDGSLVIYVRHSQDERGQPIDPLEVLDLVSRRSAVPVYGLPRDNLGHGIVGGYGTDYEQGGVRSAQAAIRILRGERAGDIPSETIQSAPMFDWRQLQRWKVSDARLPAGSTISFRDAPLLERYRRYVAGGVLIVTVQLALIGGLLLQSLRRRRAEDRSRVAEVALPERDRHAERADLPLPPRHHVDLRE